MLPGPTLPASWRSLLEVFRPAFRRGSTFALFALLATGLAARTTRRTVVGMLAGAGLTAAVSFHSACRFFSHHAWDVDPIGLVLARLIVDRLLPDGAPITVVVDDTLFRRWRSRAERHARNSATTSSSLARLTRVLGTCTWWRARIRSRQAPSSPRASAGKLRLSASS